MAMNECLKCTYFLYAHVHKVIVIQGPKIPQTGNLQPHSANLIFPLGELQSYCVDLGIFHNTPHWSSLHVYGSMTVCNLTV